MKFADHPDNFMTGCVRFFEAQASGHEVMFLIPGGLAMQMNPGCLTDEELEKFALSELGFFAQLRAEAHLSHCPVCRLALQTIVEEVA